MNGADMWNVSPKNAMLICQIGEGKWNNHPADIMVHDSVTANEAP